MGAYFLIIWGKDSLDAVYPVKRHVRMPGRGARSGWVGLYVEREQGDDDWITLNTLY